MKSNTLIPLALLGIAAILLLSPKQPQYTQQPPPPRPQQLPWQSVSNFATALNAWMLAIVKVYGTAKWLFEPGGPFYGKSKQEVQEALQLPENTAWA